MPTIANRRSLRAAVTVAAAATVLASACSGDDEVAEPTHYDQALAELPASTTAFNFRNVAATEERLGVADEHDVKAYIETTVDASWGMSALYDTLSPKVDTPWNATDVVWEAETLRGNEMSITVRRISDDVDLETAIDNLEDEGYVSEQSDDGTVLTAEWSEFNALESSVYPSFGLTMLVLPDEHLVISAAGEESLGAYTDMTESLAEAGTFDGLVGDEPLEYVHAQSGSRSCTPVTSYLGSDTKSADEARRRHREVLQMYGDIGTPDASTLTIASRGGKPAASAHLRFDDAGAAEADVTPRTQLLEEGTLPRTNTPFSKYVAVDDISVDGAVERIDLVAKDSPAQLISMVVRGEAPFLACGTS